MIEPPRVTPISAAYWRLYITANGSGSVTILAEVEMRATAGGADQCSGGTASADSTDGSNPAAKAFDNSTATYWRTPTLGSLPHWLKYAFSVPVTVAEVQLRAATGYGSQAPEDFQIQYSSDNSSWETAASFSGQTFSSGQAKTFAVDNALALAPPVSSPAGDAGRASLIHHSGI